jgi:hypothetical protein
VKRRYVLRLVVAKKENCTIRPDVQSVVHRFRRDDRNDGYTLYRILESPAFRLLQERKYEKAS